jgi:hypothetical protein
VKKKIGPSATKLTGEWRELNNKKSFTLYAFHLVLLGKQHQKLTYGLQF